MASPGTAVAAPGDAQVVHAMNQVASPLRSTRPHGNLNDLRPFGRMVGGADVVGVGEATHHSSEFFTMKHRLFRYLVEQRGFTTYSLEIGWSTGVRIDDWVRGGRGHLDDIMRQEFLGLAPWQNEEFRDLFRWMRDYNRGHPQRPVRFHGNDINFPTLGTELTAVVLDYLREHRPGLVPAVTERYQTFSTHTDGQAYLALPLADRLAIADQARQVTGLLRDLPGREGKLIQQHARSIAQTTTGLAYDYTDAEHSRAGMEFRDRVMAENTVWWREQTGQKILLSAHNGHVAYVPDSPETHPKSQGGFLREQLGREYVSVGFSFNQGSFNAKGPDGQWTETHTVGPAPEGYQEHTLDQVRYRDFLLDLRTVPRPARDWVRTARPARSIGTDYPTPDVVIALATSFDLVIHLHEIHRAHPLP